MIAFFNKLKPLTQSQSTLIITIYPYKSTKYNIYKYRYFRTHMLILFNIHKLKYCGLS